MRKSKVEEVKLLAQSLLVSLSSRILIWLCGPIHLLNVHVSRFDMLTPKLQHILHRRQMRYDKIILALTAYVVAGISCELVESNWLTSCKALVSGIVPLGCPR